MVESIKMIKRPQGPPCLKLGGQGKSSADSQACRAFGFASLPFCRKAASVTTDDYNYCNSVGWGRVDILQLAPQLPNMQVAVLPCRVPN
jgi:hypothetical protein